MTTCRTGDTSTLWPVRGRCPPSPAHSTFTTTRRCVLLASHPRSTGEETDTGQAARPRPRPQPRSRRREEAASGPRPLAPCAAAPPARPSALLPLGPQTVAECVLYYYLTKKNENYKSLVRRSYRRRGKSQVRGRRAVPSVLGGGLPPVGSPSPLTGTPSLGAAGPPRQQGTELGEVAVWFPAWKVLELGLVAQGPRGSMAGVVWLRGQRTGRRPQGPGFDSGQGHAPQLQAGSPVWSEPG